MQPTKEEIINWLDGHEQKAETTAEKRLKKNKYMMYGYWKAIAVHIRKMKKEVKNWSSQKKPKN